MSLIVKLLVALGMLYSGLVGAMYAEQRKFVYVTDGERIAPAALGLSGVQERMLATPDHQTIVTWVAKPAPGKPTILYFHGNGGNLAVRDQRIRIITAAGYGLMMMAYRGYSGSTGVPSEAANFADARLAYETLIGDGVGADHIVLYGESLGSGVAVALAAQFKVAAVVLDAPYTSIPDVAKLRYWFLPVRLLMTERYASIERIKSVHAPLLILHGENDPIIPVSMGKALFAAANEPKQLVVVPGGGHSNLMRLGAFEEVRKFLAHLPEVHL